jgi:hypothetical protein
MDRTQTQTYLNKFWNYNGSNQSDEIQAFLASNPGAASGVGKISNALNKMTRGKPTAKLNKGGYIRGYQPGGSVKKPTPPKEPTVVQEPQPIGQKPPQYGWGYNRTDGRTFEYGTAYQVGKGDANTDNPVTKRYPLGNKDAIANDVKNWLATNNKPYEEWKSKNQQYEQDKAKYDQYLKDKTKYDQDLVQYQQDVNDYNQAVTLQTAENIGQTQGAASDLAMRAYTDPASLVQQPDLAKLDPSAEGTIIGSGVGQIPDFTINPMGLSVATQPGYTATKATAAEIDAPDQLKAQTIEAQGSQQGIQSALQGFTGAQGQISAQSLVNAATTDPSQTAVGNLQAAQGTATMMQNPVQRQIQQGEIVSGVADASKALEFIGQTQAAQASPSQQAMVQEQLSELMLDFQGGNTPAWAAGAIRGAVGKMAQRGLGASSIAGQAIVQAAMESALPIAQADAQTIAQFEMQNLSNRQQTAILAAQQRAQFIGQEFDQAFQARVQNAARISDIANMNFSAEQQVALENSRAANSMNMANLSNKQAIVMAEAAAISQLEMANLSNEQQAAVQNAQAFLNMDMANLNNRQQANMFKTQSIVQSIFTDQAAENAARQFNATSQMQTDQFMENMKQQASIFNANSLNATEQFNAGQENASKQYNEGLREQRKQFNATNRLVIAQANAQWRQNVATLNTAEENENNRQFAKDVNGLTEKSLDEVWQRERDLMDMAFRGEEGRMDRILSLLLADKDLQSARETIEYADNKAKTQTLLRLFWPFGD